MTKTLLTDTVILGDVKVSKEGYLEGFVRTARTGTQTYLGRELGRPDLDRVTVLRDEGEVFSRSSLETFSKIPITLDHPAKPVDAKNWRQHAVGMTGDEVLRDGEFLKIGLKITDHDAIEKVRGGKRELSVGYSADLVWGDGIASDGTPYQAKQTAIVANHIAVVQHGRAGPRCCIGDSYAEFNDGAKETKPMNMKTVFVDGIPVETNDAGAAVIESLKQKLVDAGAKFSAAATEHSTALAAKDAEIATRDAKIDDLSSKVLDAASLDKAVAARADLVSKAKALAPNVVTDGKSDADIRKAVVAAKIGDAAMVGKSDHYVDARFDILCEGIKTQDKAADVIGQGLTNDSVNLVAQRDKALADHRSYLENAYRGIDSNAA